MLTSAEFRTNAYLINRNHVDVTEIAYNDHQRERADQTFGHTITPANFPGVKSVNLTAGADTVYLPYYDNKVSSVKVPENGPSVFFTDNLSGCAVYIGKKTDNTLVVFHSNTHLDSSESDMKGKAANHQTARAVRKLDGLVGAAKLDYAGGITMLSVLAKTRYLGRISQLTASEAGFLGGTTVAGFRAGKKWEFWFQNFGSINGGAVGLQHVEKFFEYTYP